MVRPQSLHKVLDVLKKLTLRTPDFEMTISRLGFKFGTMVISKLVNVRKGARKCDPRHNLFLNFRAPSVRAPRTLYPGYQKPTGALHRYHKTARFFELNEMVV